MLHSRSKRRTRRRSGRLDSTLQAQCHNVDRGQYWLLPSLKQAAIQGNLLDEDESKCRQRFAQDMDRFWREMVLGQDGSLIMMEQLDSLTIQYWVPRDDGDDSDERNKRRQEKHRLWCHLSIFRSNVSNEIASRIESVVDKVDKDNHTPNSEFLLCMNDVPCSEVVLDVIVRTMYTGQVRADYFGDLYFDVSMLRDPTLVSQTELSKEEDHRLDVWIRTMCELFAVAQHLQMHNDSIKSFLYLQLDELTRHGFSHNLFTRTTILGSTLLDTFLSHVSASSQSQRFRSLTLAQPEWNIYEQRKSHGDIILRLDTDDYTESTKQSVVLHKSVLMARSEYFRNMFLSRMSESNMPQVKLPLCQSYFVLKSYVFYLYHGYLCSEDLGEIGVELIGIAKFMNDVHLMSLCEEAIAERVDVTTIIELYSIAKDMSLSGLVSRCEKMLVYLRETGEMKNIPAFDMNEITKQYQLSYQFQRAECLEGICNSLYLQCVFIVDECQDFDFWRVVHSFLIRNGAIGKQFDEKHLSNANHFIQFKDSSNCCPAKVKFDAIPTSDLAVEQRLSALKPNHLFFVTSARNVTEATVKRATELYDMIPPRNFNGCDHFFTLVIGDSHITQVVDTTKVRSTLPSRLVNFCELGPLEDSSEIIDHMFFSAFQRPPLQVIQ